MNDRRRILQGAAGLAIGWLTPVAGDAQTKPEVTRPTKGDALVKIGDTALVPLTLNDVVVGAKPIVAWAMEPASKLVRSGSRLNRVLVLRLDQAALTPQTNALAAAGVVAYSAICTHAGCDVGTLLVEEQQLFCECHESRFDPRDGARVTDGPAPRSLPALPLEIVDGALKVAGPFTTRPGFTEG
jgi:rieske iron-sulfur protein